MNQKLSESLRTVQRLENELTQAQDKFIESKKGVDTERKQNENLKNDLIKLKTINETLEL